MTLMAASLEKHTDMVKDLAWRWGYGNTEGNINGLSSLYNGRLALPPQPTKILARKLDLSCMRMLEARKEWEI